MEQFDRRADVGKRRVLFSRLPDPDALTDREREQARWHPERETLELAAAGAAQVLGVDHSVTRALARASLTMATVDLWRARLAVKTLRRDQRQAIAEAAEGRQGSLHFFTPGVTPGGIR